MNNLFTPQVIDNHFRGYKLALYLFWIVIIMRGLQGIVVVFGGASTVRDADGIPLDTFPAVASQSIVAVFVLAGFTRLVLSILGVVTFVRYKSAIGLMFAVLLLDQLGKEILLQFYPPFRSGNPIGPIVNRGLLILTLLGLVLSITGRKSSKKVFNTAPQSSMNSPV